LSELWVSSVRSHVAGIEMVRKVEAEKRQSYQHPAVAAAATIGVPDSLYGEEVAAFIILKNGVKVSQEDLIDFCRERLADYKCPKSIGFVSDIPKGPTGKLLKRELASRFAKR